MKKNAKFEDLFQEAIADLYDAEKQIVAALPKMMAAASLEELSTTFESHLEETREQVSRLESIFERMGEQPGNRECRAMRALLSEGERLVGELEKSPVLDVALIAAARKVEHYEIAAYASACGLAEMLGQQDTFDLLQDTLEEETTAEETLAEIAEAILTGDATPEEADAVGVEETEEEEV